MNRFVIDDEEDEETPSGDHEKQRSIQEGESSNSNTTPREILFSIDDE